MPFMIQCDNKGCGKMNEPKLNVETNTVECEYCSKNIQNVTSFAKVQLKALGQIKKAGADKRSFTVDCVTCKKKTCPVVNGNEGFCEFCNEKLNLSTPFLELIRNNAKTNKNS